MQNSKSKAHLEPYFPQTVALLSLFIKFKIGSLPKQGFKTETFYAYWVVYLFKFFE